MVLQTVYDTILLKADSEFHLGAVRIQGSSSRVGRGGRGDDCVIKGDLVIRLGRYSGNDSSLVGVSRMLGF